MTSVKQLYHLNALKLLSQSEFPSFSSILSNLVLAAIVVRNAGEIILNISDPTSFRMFDDGRLMSEDEIRKLWQVLSGVASVDLISWDFAAVPQVHVLQHGWIRPGTHEEFSICKGPAGCRTKVYSLFDRLPVRRRRLGTVSSIKSEVVRDLEKLSLVYPNVGIECYYDGRRIFRHEKTSSLKQSFVKLIGESKSLFMDEFRMSRMRGIVSSHPNGLHHSRALQIVLDEATIECPYEADINEAFAIAFKRVSGRAYLQLTNIHNRAFHLAYVVICTDREPWAKETLLQTALSLLELTDWSGHLQRLLAESTDEDYAEDQAAKIRADQEDKPEKKRRETGGVVTGEREKVRITREDLQDCSIIGQANNEFIALKSLHSNQLIFVDQHAADERVRFERISRDILEMREMESIVAVKCKDVPALNKQLSYAPSSALRITKRERELLSQHRCYVESWGFHWVEGVDRFEIQVTTVPQVYGVKLAPQAILEMITGDLSDSSAIPTPFKRLIASRACRGAIMFGQPLTLGQCQQIISELMDCNFPFQCAHGRPSVVPAHIQLC